LGKKTWGCGKRLEHEKEEGMGVPLAAGLVLCLRCEKEPSQDARREKNPKVRGSDPKGKKTRLGSSRRQTPKEPRIRNVWSPTEP